MVDLGQKGWKQFHLFYFGKTGREREKIAALEEEREKIAALKEERRKIAAQRRKTKRKKKPPDTN